MLIQSGLTFRGDITVSVRNLRTGKVETTVFRNAVVDDGLDLVKDALLGNVTDLEIKYVALGDDNTAVTGTESLLGNEIFRKQVTSKTDTGIGQLQTIGLILASEAAQQIEEIGWFGGAGATASANSGTLWARVLYSRNKTDLESIQITRDDTIARV